MARRTFLPVPHVHPSQHDMLSRSAIYLSMDDTFARWRSVRHIVFRTLKLFHRLDVIVLFFYFFADPVILMKNPPCASPTLSLFSSLYYILFLWKMQRLLMISCPAFAYGIAFHAFSVQIHFLPEHKSQFFCQTFRCFISFLDQTV